MNPKMINRYCCAVFDTLDESKQLFSVENQSLMLADKSQSTRCWFSYVKKNEIFLNRIYRDIRILFKHIQRTGCSRKELYGEEYDAVKDLSDAVDEHVQDTADTRTDLYVLHFAPDHGELLYKKMKECTFLKDNMLNPDEKSSEVLAEASKMVKSAKSEAEKKKKDADKSQNQNEQGGGNNNDNHNYRYNSPNYYQSKGAGRGWGFNSTWNSNYSPAYYQQRFPESYPQFFPAPQNLFPNRLQQYMPQYAPQGFMQPKAEGK